MLRIDTQNQRQTDTQTHTGADYRYTHLTAVSVRSLLAMSQGCSTWFNKFWL